MGRSQVNDVEIIGILHFKKLFNSVKETKFCNSLFSIFIFGKLSKTLQNYCNFFGKLFFKFFFQIIKNCFILYEAGSLILWPAMDGHQLVNSMEPLIQVRFRVLQNRMALPGRLSPGCAGCGTPSGSSWPSTAVPQCHLEIALQLLLYALHNCSQLLHHEGMKGPLGHMVSRQALTHTLASFSIPRCSSLHGRRLSLSTQERVHLPLFHLEVESFVLTIPSRHRRCYLKTVTHKQNQSQLQAQSHSWYVKLYYKDFIQLVNNYTPPSQSPQTHTHTLFVASVLLSSIVPHARWSHSDTNSTLFSPPSLCCQRQQGHHPQHCCYPMLITVRTQMLLLAVARANCVPRKIQVLRSILILNLRLWGWILSFLSKFSKILTHFHVNIIKHCHITLNFTIISNINIFKSKSYMVL